VFADGSVTVDVENALNLDEATGFNASLNIKDQSLILTLGGRKVNTVEPKIWLPSFSEGRSIHKVFWEPIHSLTTFRIQISFSWRIRPQDFTVEVGQPPVR
jgi:hypothetical protein